MESVRELFFSLSRWSVVALAALLPVFFLPGGFVTVPQGKLLLVSVAVMLATFFFVIASILEKGIRIPRNILFFAAALLPLAYVVSTAIAGWPASSVVSGLAEQDTVVSVALWFGVFAVGALVVARDGLIAVGIIRALVLGILALVLFHIARLFVPDMLAFGGVFPTATATAVGSWHDLGIVLGCGVILCGALFRTRIAGAGVWKWCFAATAILSFLFLIVVSMQDIWFVLAGITGIFGIYAYFAAVPAKMQTTQVAAGQWVQAPVEQTDGRPAFGLRAMRASMWIAIALISFLLGWFNVWIHDHLPQKLQVTAVEVRPSWEGTLSVGQSSLSDSRALLFGTGPNSFARNWALYKPEGVNATLFWNFDFNSGVGVVPTSFVTIGIIGVAAWALFVLTFLWAAGKALSATRLFDATQTTVFCIICAIMFLFAFHVMYAPGVAVSTLLFLLTGVFIALPLSEYVRSTVAVPFSFETVGRFLSLVGTIGAAIALSVAGGISLQALSSDVLVNRSIMFYNQTNDISTAKGLIEQSFKLWSSNDRAHRAAVELGILELGKLAQSAPTDTAAAQALQKTLSETIDHGLAAIAIDRIDYQNWLTLALLYQELAGAGVQGAYEQAQSAYTSASNENPTSPLPLFRLAQLETARGNRAGALEHLNAALALKQDFAPAHFMRSQLLAQENKLQDAVQSAVASVQLVPQDPLGWYNLGVILYMGGSYSEAGAAFVQAVTLRGDYSNALFMLGLSFFQVGQHEQALATLARVAELNPTDQTVPAMMGNIRAGKDPFEGLGGTQ